MWKLKLTHRLGISLLETVIVLLIASATLRGLYMVIDSHINEQLRISAAHQMKEVVAAAREHIQDRNNYVALLNNPSITSGVTLSDIPVMGRPLNELQNIYQQGYEVRVRAMNNAFGQRQLMAAVVTTGGEALSAEDGHAIARSAGGRSGFVAGGLLHGPVASMNLNLSDFGGVANGRLFSAVLLSQSGDYNSDGLFREAVPGRPDLNTAQTDFEMNQNSVRNVLRTQATSVIVTDVSGGETAASRQVQINEAQIDRVNADLMEATTLTTNNLYVTQDAGGRSNNVNGAAQGTLVGTGNATVEGDTHVHGRSNGKTNVHGVAPNASTVPMIEGINTRTGNIDTQGGNVYVHHIKASGQVLVENSGQFNLPSETIGTPCRHAGAVAIEGDVLLVCRGGKWQSNLRADFSFGASNHGDTIDRTLYPSYGGYYERNNIPGRWEACFLKGFQQPSELGTMVGYGSNAVSTRVMVRTERLGCCGGGGPDDLYAETDSAVVVDFLADHRHAGDSTCYVGRDAAGNWYVEHRQETFAGDFTWCSVGCIK